MNAFQTIKIDLPISWDEQLKKDWHSNLAEEACTHGAIDAVREGDMAEAELAAEDAVRCTFDDCSFVIEWGAEKVLTDGVTEQHLRELFKKHLVIVAKEEAMCEECYEHAENDDPNAPAPICADCGTLRS